MSARGPMICAGVDVGGARKGFHAAIVEGKRVIAGPKHLRCPPDVVAWLADWKPRLVAVDSPRRPARQGQRSRDCERTFTAAKICGIRYTPDERAVRSNPYYEWVVNGFLLYEALMQHGIKTIECFPTASWTCWFGQRGTRRRTIWSRQALSALGLAGVRSRLNQDDRDAIAAALTASDHLAQRTQCFGDIVVPIPRA